MLTLVAFVVALGLLIAVHEYGHYRMAVACGVRVLRFSIGFGRTLLRWQPRGSDTEFTLCAFPLGGYVRMLDEREAPVAPQDRPHAFNTQPLRSRALIVAAGPAANLLLAVLLYALVNWSGVKLPAAVLGSPVAGSVAERAGVQAGERVLRAGFDGDALDSIGSFEDVRWWLTRGALERHDVRLALSNGTGSERELVLPLAQMGAQDADAALFRRIGIVAPYGRPVIGEVMAGGAAERAGLLQGDVVLHIGGQAVQDGAQLRDLIRASVQGPGTVAATWRVLRDGQALDVHVRPDLAQDGAQAIGRIGAFVGAAPEFARIAGYGFCSGRSTHANRLQTIRDTARTTGRIVDTHTADGLFVAQQWRDPGVPMVCLETALPAKFNDTIREALGQDAPRPPVYQDIEARVQRFALMPRDVSMLKRYIAERCPVHA